MSKRSPTDSVASGCRCGQSVPAYVQGELAAHELTDFEKHLAGCLQCRQQVSEVAEVIDLLKSAPAAPLMRDLAPGIIARIPQNAWNKPAAPAARLSRSYRVWLSALAASVLLAFMGGGLALKQRHSGGAVRKEVRQALDWLAASQEADGAWAPEKWGGQQQYRVGLTGLALLAFMGAEEKPLAGRLAGPIHRAVGFIERQQQPDGRFGPAFSGAVYNHAIATAALLEVFALSRDARLKERLDRALDFICRQQAAEGGWGYLGVPGAPNTSITAWQLQALLVAGSLGWPRARAAAHEGLAWLAGTVDAHGRAGYRRQGDFPYGTRNLSAMAAMCLFLGAGAEHGNAAATPSLAYALALQPDTVDYYQWYYVSHAAYAAPGAEAVLHSAQVAELTEALLAHQSRSGPEAGSWEPSDQWSRAGGRVYSTAMAALSLEAERRTQRLLAWVDNSH